LRRAARWDGVFPEDPSGDRLAPDAVKQRLAYIAQHREDSGPFDCVLAGASTDLPDGELERYEAVGVTWWLESIWPNVELSEVRSRIASGSPS
jgi:hypothetical protein